MRLNLSFSLLHLLAFEVALDQISSVKQLKKGVHIAVAEVM